MRRGSFYSKLLLILTTLVVAYPVSAGNTSEPTIVRPIRKDRVGCLVAVTEAAEGNRIVVGTLGLEMPLTWRMPLGEHSNGFNDIRTSLVGTLSRSIAGDPHRFEIPMHASDFVRFGGVTQVRIELTDKNGKQAACNVPL